MKRAIELLYSLYLLKGTYPFVYLSLNMPPNSLDVNVHPSKLEVIMEHDSEIIERITSEIEKILKFNSTTPVASLVKSKNPSRIENSRIHFLFVFID